MSTTLLFLTNRISVRVVYSEDFTGEGRTDDPYGHGTHVASLAAGNGRISNGEYVGIAPNASLINLRVLNADGVGTTAWVLRALDWVASNRAAYNIRVVNMSLGMPAVDSYRNDPICRAVRRLVDAGVVVFAAAGTTAKTVKETSFTVTFTRRATSLRRSLLELQTLLAPTNGVTMQSHPSARVDQHAASRPTKKASNTTTTWSNPISLHPATN